MGNTMTPAGPATAAFNPGVGMMPANLNNIAGYTPQGVGNVELAAGLAASAATQQQGMANNLLMNASQQQQQLLAMQNQQLTAGTETSGYGQ